MKKDIFEFNHIDNLLSEDEIKTIKEFYEYYHKKFWCFKKTYKHFKILDESITRPAQFALLNFLMYQKHASNVNHKHTVSEKYLS